VTGHGIGHHAQNLGENYRVEKYCGLR
jgi:hypothetical protein